jgi:type III secretion protein J
MAAALALLAGCGEEELLHGLDEAQANQVLVALEDGGLRGRKRREEGSEAGYLVEVAADAAPGAQRILAERELPRPRAPGFGEVFGKGSMVPTPVEERALYLHALAGELSRSLEAIDGVVEARVHLALPPEELIRPEARRPARAAVLLKHAPAARASLESMRSGIQSLVAGAADGLEASAVAVVLAETTPSVRPPAPRSLPRRWILLALAGLAAVVGIGCAALAVSGGWGRWGRSVRLLQRSAP